MKIDEATLDRIAELARLDMSDPAVRATLIDFVEALNQVDTTGVEPLVFLNEELDVLRADTPALEISKEEALGNAPLKDSDYFKVPRVMGNG